MLILSKKSQRATFVIGWEIMQWNIVSHIVLWVSFLFLNISLGVDVNANQLFDHLNDQLAHYTHSRHICLLRKFNSNKTLHKYSQCDRFPCTSSHWWSASNSFQLSKLFLHRLFPHSIERRSLYSIDLGLFWLNYKLKLIKTTKVQRKHTMF